MEKGHHPSDEKENTNNEGRYSTASRVHTSRRQKAAKKKKVG